MKDKHTKKFKSLMDKGNPPQAIEGIVLGWDNLKTYMITVYGEKFYLWNEDLNPTWPEMMQGYVDRFITVKRLYDNVYYIKMDEYFKGENLAETFL